MTTVARVTASNWLPGAVAARLRDRLDAVRVKGSTARASWERLASKLVGAADREARNVGHATTHATAEAFHSAADATAFAIDVLELEVAVQVLHRSLPHAGPSIQKALTELIISLARRSRLGAHTPLETLPGRHHVEVLHSWAPAEDEAHAIQALHVSLSSETISRPTSEERRPAALAAYAHQHVLRLKTTVCLDLKMCDEPFVFVVRGTAGCLRYPLAELKLRSFRTQFEAIIYMVHDSEDNAVRKFFVAIHDSS